jgi:hypothetical protein
MTNSTTIIESKAERRVPASQDEVFDAWLNPRSLAIAGMQRKSSYWIRK